MTTFKINPLVLAMAIALPATLQVQGAFAQEDDTIEEIQVTGFRESLASALSIKKEQNGFVDAIVASDIAEFPDNNLAESLQRVPGVAIQRSGGEGRGITVRGLGPTFTTVRLNGMETISTTGGTDAVGGNNRGRGFDFNTFSSDLFSSLTVRKTNSAEVQEGSLGATVDLKAAQPFDYDGFVFTAAGSLGYNDLSEENDPGASFLVSDTFNDGTFGALFSLSYSGRQVQDEGSSTGRWSNAAGDRFSSSQLGSAATTTPLTATDPINTAFHPRLPRYDSYKHEMERIGSSLSLQFRPTDTTEISVDGLFARFEASREESFFSSVMNGTISAVPPINLNVRDYEIRGNTMVYGKVEGARLWAENRYDEMTTDFSQATVSLKQDFTDSFRMKAMVGTTKSDYDNPIQNTVIMIANNQSFTFDYRDYDSPALTFGDTAYTKAPWTAFSVRQRPQATVNQNDAQNVSFEFDLNDEIKLKAGIDHKDFTFETNQFALTSGEGINGVNIQAKPEYIVEYDSGLGDGRNWLLPNRSLIMSDYNLFKAPMSPNYGSTFEVEEETSGVFAQVDFKFDLFSVPVRGDLGVRQFKTEQTSVGYDRAGIGYTVTHEYDDLLPALNLVVEPIEDLLVRFAYSDGISRAGLSQLSPTTDVTVSGSSRAVSRGNPFLEPTKATSVDLGVEWYFAEGSSLGLTLFTKDLKSFIQTSRVDLPYTNLMAQYGLSLDALKAACGTTNYGNGTCTEALNWQYSVPYNSPGGDLTGYELSYQQPFTFLPGALANFGFIGSFTSVESDVDYLDALDKTKVLATKPLVNLSDRTASATIYYEDEKFNGRVSLTNRSGYLTTPIGRNGNAEEGTNATTNVDASFGYQFNDSLKFTLEALNLTDEADDQWVGSESEQRLSYYHQTGRQYNIGVQYKFK